MKNDVYQPTATDNLTSNEEGGLETSVRYKVATSLSLIWRFVILILLFLVIAMMIALIIVSKKLSKLKNCQVCPTVPGNLTVT